MRKSGRRVKHLYIVRHGQTEWNLEQRMQGRLDSPLTDLGREQARLNGALIKSLGGVDRLWVSPSGRTMETAYIINSHTQAQLDFAEELLERDCGHWSGRTVAEIETDYPAAWAERSADPYWFQPPGGENLEDMLERANMFLEELFDLDWNAVALVTHGVMSKVVLRFFLGLTEVETARLRHPNDLVYGLTFNAEDIETQHFFAVGDARTGPLRSTDDQHIEPLKRP